MDSHLQARLIAYVAIAAIVVLAIVRRMRRRKIRMGTLLVFPLILVVIAAFVIASEPALDPTSLAVMAGALLVGGAIGWQRGRFTHIDVDPATHALSSKASPIGLIIFAGVFAARFALRGYAAELHDQRLTLMVTNGLLAFAVGMISAQQLEIWLRCKRLLAQAKAGRP